MTIEKINQARDQFNGVWPNSFFDAFWDLFKRIINGDIYDEEELAVLSAGHFVEHFKGWTFQLPSTKEVFECKTIGYVKIIYDEYLPTIGEFKGTYEKEEILKIPRNWDEFDALDGHYPEAIQRFLDECRPWKYVE